MKAGGIFGDHEIDPSNYEPVEDCQHGPMSCLAAAVSMAMQWTATDFDAWTPPIQERTRAIFRPEERDGITPAELVLFLRGQTWPLAFKFGLRRCKLPLSLLRPPKGMAFVPLLAGDPIGHAVVVVSRRPGELFDPGPGQGRAPTADDEARWNKGGRVALVVAYTP